MADLLILDVEEFAYLHPGLNGPLLLEYARVALAGYHTSPASFQVHRSDDAELIVAVRFGKPHPL